MKSTRLLLLTSVLVAGLTCALVAAAQVGQQEPAGTELGTVKVGKKNDTAKLVVSADGSLSLGQAKITQLLLKDGSKYLPGKSSSPRKVTLGARGEILVDGVQTIKLGFAGRGNRVVLRSWIDVCSCVEPPLPPGPPPPPDKRLPATNPLRRQQ